jgi:hypothetical protein
VRNYRKTGTFALSEKVNYPLTILSPIFILLASLHPANTDIRSAKLLHQMYDSIKNIKTLRMKISALERIEKKFVSANSEIKVQTHPRKVYFHNRHKKLEILYDSEIMPDKAYVKPHVFPYMTISLDPRGNLMRKNQHYTIHELGFDFIGRSVLLTLNKDKDGINNFSYLGTHAKSGYNCHLLEYENKAYGYTEYTIAERETASSIAYKLCVNDYLFRYANDLLNDFGYLKRGRKLRVPTLYCKKAIIYLDEKTCLPVSISLYDDVGLFESYEFSAIEINRGFSTDDFSLRNKAYGF